MIRLALLAVLFVAVLPCGIGGAVPEPELQSLSGTLRDDHKSEFRFYLQLDGMTGNMEVTGDVLKQLKAGDHVFVRGVVKTRLIQAQGGGTAVQQPIHWMIFMDVHDARPITSPFGLEEG